MAIVVVVCGEMCVEIEKLLDWNKIGVVVDIDPMIMIVVTKRQKDKKEKGQKDKKTKRQKDKKTKIIIDKKTKIQKYKNTKIQKKNIKTKRQKSQQKKIQGAQRLPMPSAGARTRGPAAPKVLVFYKNKNKIMSVYAHVYFSCFNNT